MCGIAGKIIFPEGEIKKSELKLMAQKIAHRGPDDEGIFLSLDKKVGLVNRRLAIIDLSRAGHQPMNYKNRYWITFNGEVYNFQTERKKLERQGYKFKSKTDTEVILALYDKYKINCLKHLRGMFAFAIYDEKEKTLFLARDRIGKKPLKYYFDGSVFIFASELKAILTQKEVRASPDLIAIHNYLTYGYVPSPATGFENINKLQPGHYMTLDTKTRKLLIKRYWFPDFSQKLTLSEPEWCKRILEELEEATRLRMIADVPIGAFLSGGVDSSSVVATMALLSTKPIKTFTIGFKDQINDERPYAQRIAKFYHTDHETLIAEPEAIEDLLPKLVSQFEEPYSDSSAIITYMVCKMAKKYVSVVLTGDGGDESFGGYDNRMRRLKRDVALNNFLPALRAIGIPFSLFLTNKTRGSTWARINKFLEKSKIDIADRYVTYNCIFTKEDKEVLYLNEFKKITKNTDTYEVARKIFSQSKTLDVRDQALFFDLVSWLPNSQLVKVDITGMAVSLEARSPFLDQKMIELANQIPFDLKVHGYEYKYILKKAVEKIVPKENLYRKKMGFTIPLHKWFKGKLNSYAKSELLAKKSNVGKFLNKDRVREMLETHSGPTDFGPKLWSLLTLELWFKRYF